KRATPALLHPEERVGQVERPAAQIEKLVQRSDLLNGALDREAPPAHLALRPLHAERTVEGAAARQIDLCLRGDAARDRAVAHKIAPVGRREIVELVD